ncbi:MAG TPA: penicillin acylase family protein [Bacteroidota bacterium]|nr:penicillin acylase family protein [Bacteroidota bacterium]
MKTRLKILLGIGGSLILIGLVTILILRYLVTKSFPTVDGELRVPGLLKPVIVERDEYGVPHLFAQNEHDLFFAQGYVHAQDRLWQMDVSRRAGEGRLSEVFGPSTLKFDRLFRTVGMLRIAERIAENLHPESRELLQSYSDGVNAFIASHKGKYPIEFDMLNYEPEPWTPVHSILVARLMAWELNISWYVDLVLGELYKDLGEEKAKEIFPTYPENAPVIVPKELKGSMLSDNLLGLIDVDREFRAFDGISGTHIGSNAWAVSPEKSLSGMAMLANDPHLGFSAPSKWYEIHLAGGRFNVEGVSIPGTPLVVIGRNTHVAWGLTNVMADDADFYLEMTNSAGEYLFKDTWHPMTTELDTIVVKDSASVILTLKSTHHGPIINDVNPVGSITSQVLVSMRWTGQDLSDEIYALSQIDRAGNWDEFRSGVKEFTVPGQNFVYADDAGNIGYTAGVRLPIRSAQNPTLPMPGWTGEYEWNGFVPYEKLPYLYNPPQHFIATANNKLTNGAFPYHISNLWEPPSRIQRLEELLSTKQKLSAEDFQSIQLDYFSYFAKEMTPYILHAYDSVAVKSADVQTALNYFGNWHYQLSRDDVPTTLFHVYFTHLLRNIFQNKMGEGLFEKYIFIANIPYRTVPALFRNPDSPWFDDPATPRVERRDDVIRKSLDEAISELKVTLGGEMKTWRWGLLHTLTFRHPFGSQPPLGSVFNIGPFPVGGSGTTLNNGEYYLAEPYQVTLGPSMREIVDFAHPEASRYVIPTGESGQPLNDHYSDQTELWLNGEYDVIPIDSAFAVSTARHTLILSPAP